MRTVRHLLEAKAPEVFAIGLDEPVIDAIRLMAEKRIGAVVVMQAGRLVGILSERDYARKIALRARSSRETAVRDIITSAKEPRFRKVLLERTQSPYRPCGLGSWRPLQS